METWFWESWKSCGGGKSGYWNPEWAGNCQQLFVSVTGHNIGSYKAEPGLNPDSPLPNDMVSGVINMEEIVGW